MRGVIHVGGWDGREYVQDPRRPLLIFEPGAATFKILQANFADHPDVELANAAVGARAGKATLYVFDPSHSSSLLKPLVSTYSTVVINSIAYAGTERVKVVTLDGYLKGRDGFGLLRIDTQGYELEVLRGARKTLKRLERVELELHTPDVYEGAATLGELDSFLDGEGWERTGLDTANSDGLGDCVYEKR